MGIACTNDVISGDWIVFARAEAVHNASGHSKRSHHHRHRGCEVFAVTFLAPKEKIGQWIFRMTSGHFKRVAKTGPQIMLDSRSLIELCMSIYGDLPG